MLADNRQYGTFAAPTTVKPAPLGQHTSEELNPSPAARSIPSRIPVLAFPAPLARSGGLGVPVYAVAALTPLIIVNLNLLH
jgi:hypothetical protein